VLLVYSRVGGGHLSAARALATELDATGRASARIVDSYVEAGRFPLTQFPRVYAWLARKHPHLWSTIYRLADWANPDRILGRSLRPGLERLMAAERPDLIVSVLPAINGLLAKVSVDVGARMEVVLTDWHSVHRMWVAHGVQHYTVATESALEDCVRFGAPRRDVDVVGIPVRREFGEARPPARFGKPMILAMVGAEGSPNALRNLAQLAQLELDAELVVVCGRNEALRTRVAKLPARMPVRALGLVDNVAELMRSAEVLVTKAGGLTLAEAFCCGVPVIVHDVLPGQEAGNLAYVLNQRAVAYAPDARALVRAVTGLHEDSVRRSELAARGRRLARPDAAGRIARGMLARLDAG
jgi:UDP-N-acetylglucosamine:LPS N-acetylglucosamine transferase